MLGTNKLEFRVYVFGNSYVEHQSTTLTQESTLPPVAALFCEANDPALAIQSVMPKAWRGLQGQQMVTTPLR
jgi:hypothetical protein